jgi:hypothetical protein
MIPVEHFPCNGHPKDQVFIICIFAVHQMYKSWLKGEHCTVFFRIVYGG